MEFRNLDQSRYPHLDIKHKARDVRLATVAEICDMIDIENPDLIKHLHGKEPQTAVLPALNSTNSYKIENPDVIMYAIMKNCPRSLQVLLSRYSVMSGYLPSTEKAQQIVDYFVVCVLSKASDCLLVLLDNNVVYGDIYTKKVSYYGTQMTVLCISLIENYYNTARYLIGYNFDPFVVNTDGTTSLHISIRYYPIFFDILMIAMRTKSPRKLLNSLTSPVEDCENAIAYAIKYSQNDIANNITNLMKQLSEDIESESPQQTAVTCCIEGCVSLRRLSLCHICHKPYCSTHISCHGHTNLCFLNKDVSLVYSMNADFSLASGGTVEDSNYGIYPYHPLRRFWEYMMYGLSLLVIWEVPFEWCFNLEKSMIYFIPAITIDAIFLIDIFIVKRTGILQYGIIKLDKASIDANVPSWRLFIYWLSPWPFYLIGWFNNNDSLYQYLLLLKLFRLVRLYDSYSIIRNTLVYISPVSKMATLFTMLFTIVHVFACIFWYTGHREIPNKSWIIEVGISEKPLIIQYFHTVYYITTTILTIGYGDIHPFTFNEICVVIGVEAFGVFFYNFLVSNMVSIVADPSRNSFLSKYQRIYSAFKWRGISDESMCELLRYYEYVWERDRDRADFYETASKMPEGLQKRLALALHMEVFNKVDALRGASEEALEKVAMALRPRIFTPGDFLIKVGRVSSRMYFVTEGKIDMISGSGTLLNVLDGANGCVLGEASVINGSEEVASAIAETYVEAFELMKEDFDEIVQDFPQLQHNLMKKSPSLGATITDTL